MAAGGERRDINRIFFQTFAGHEQHRLILAVEDWYQGIRNQPNFFIQSSLRELRTHQDNGVTPVFVSGSSQEILAPLARELNVVHVLANNLEVTSARPEIAFLGGLVRFFETGCGQETPGCS